MNKNKHLNKANEVNQRYASVAYKMIVKLFFDTEIFQINIIIIIQEILIALNYVSILHKMKAMHIASHQISAVGESFTFSLICSYIAVSSVKFVYTSILSTSDTFFCTL